MVHTCWRCPKIRRFWIKVFDFIHLIMDVNLIRSPEIALFQKWDKDLSKQTKHLISYIILAGRIAFAPCWNHSIVMFDYVKQKFSWIMINKMTCTLHNHQTKLNNTTLGTIPIFDT